MAYYNENDDQYYDSRGDRNRGRRSSFRGRGNSSQRSNYDSRPRKRTGCKQGMDKNGSMYLYGHRFLQNGVMIASAFKAPDGKNRDGSKRINVGVDKDTGAVKWERYLVSVQTGGSIAMARASATNTMSAFWYPAKGHLIIPELSVMMKPSSNYFGKVKRTD